MIGIVAGTRAKLVGSGLPRLTLETLQRYPRNESVFAAACALVLLLTSDAGRRSIDLVENREENGDDDSTSNSNSPVVGPTSMCLWPTRTLVELLTTATLDFSDSLAYDEFYQATHDVLQCLLSAPRLCDVDENGTRDC